MPVDVADRDTRDEVFDAHALADEEPDFGRRDIVSDELIDLFEQRERERARTGTVRSAREGEGERKKKTRHVDLVSVECERGPRMDRRRREDGLVEFRFGAFNDVAPVDAEDVVKLRRG